MSTLYLPIKRKWFEEIISGRKKIEYRALSKHWTRRILTASPAGRLMFKYLDTACLHVGYGAKAPKALVEIDKITIEKAGHPDTGDIGVLFLIHLGKILEIKNLKGVV
jgi:hypothetical protein